jgi:hypothetical protein
MKANMDDEILAYQLRKEEKPSHSMTQWLIIIALGVFIGNMATFGVEKAVFYWELKQVGLAASAAMKESNEKMLAQRRIMEANSAERKRAIDEKNKIRQIQNEQKQAGLRQATETCNFWRQQVKGENSVKNRRNTEEACALMNRFR